jgi:putative SOS response-associated peptidase YedK
MCNRYGYQAPYSKLLEEFSHVLPVHWAGAEPNAPRDDIRPTDPAPILRPTEDGQTLKLVELRWGLIPWFHKGALKDFKGLNTNARSETVGQLASFKGPYARRRCLVPATHYFEWTGAKSPKTMWRFTVPGQDVFAFPGLWERAQTADGPIESFTLLTSAPGPDQAPYHSRQPVILECRDWGNWLDVGKDMAPTFTGSAARSVAVDYLAGSHVAKPPGAA